MYEAVYLFITPRTKTEWGTPLSFWDSSVFLMNILMGVDKTKIEMLSLPQKRMSHNKQRPILSLRGQDSTQRKLQHCLEFSSSFSAHHP